MKRVKRCVLIGVIAQAQFDKFGHIFSINRHFNYNGHNLGKEPCNEVCKERRVSL